MTGGGRKLCDEDLYNLFLNQSERNFVIRNMHAWVRDKNFLKLFVGRFDLEDVMKNLA